MVKFCDVYVNDVFGIVYCVEVIMYGIVKYVFVVCVGLLLVVEFDVFGKVFGNLVCLLVVIVVGLKVLIKLIILKLLVGKVD